jgi:hypothetical protein
MLPFEMEEILDGSLFTDDRKALLESLRKYIVLFCRCRVPEDLEIMHVEKDYNCGCHNIYVCSTQFPKAATGCAAECWMLTDQEAIQRRMQEIPIE